MHRGGEPRRAEGTFQVNNTARRPKITVSADGRGLVSQAARLLRAAVSLSPDVSAILIHTGQASHHKRTRHKGTIAMTDFDPRPHGAYAVSVVVVAVLLLLAMLAMLFAVLFVVHSIASTI